jgi:hypothetical protein
VTGIAGVLLASISLWIGPLSLRAPTLRGEDERPLFIRGDANIDRRTTLADVFTILRYLWTGEGSLPCKTAADVDDDGVISQADALYLLGSLFYRHSPPPQPFGKPGTDPTPDDNLGCRQGLRSATGGGIAEQGQGDDGAVPAPGSSDCEKDRWGAELDFIHFRGPVLALPGESRIRVPIELESPFGLLEGFTLSLQAPPGIHLENLDFHGTVVSALSPQWIHVYKGQAASGFLAASVALSITPPFRTLPKLHGETVAFLEFSVAPDAIVGSRLEILFASTPGVGELPPISTEVSRQGNTQSHGSCGLAVEIVSGEDVFIRGDANRDRLVNITDVVRILRELFSDDSLERSFPCADAADVDDSGEVSLTDAVRLARFLFGLAPAPRTPFPEAGRDSLPDQDGLGCVPGS